MENTNTKQVNPEKCMIIRTMEENVIKAFEGGDDMFCYLYEDNNPYCPLAKAEQYPYVLSVEDNVVVDVYETIRWEKREEPGNYLDDDGDVYTLFYDMYKFDGKPAPQHYRDFFIGKTIPKVYRDKLLVDETVSPDSKITWDEEKDDKYFEEYRQKELKQIEEIIMKMSWPQNQKYELLAVICKFEYPSMFFQPLKEVMYK